MKLITNEYKNNVKLFGREIDSIITYIVGSEEIELGAEDLNSVILHYNGSILKSVMKQLDIDSNEDIPLGTEINCQFGVKVGNNFEYIDFGNYIVYSSEKQEDKNSYLIICYDKMLKTMKPYEDLNITYPITINNYIKAICTHLGLTFANDGEQFANYDKQIQQELYLDNGGNSLNYTFRDVLDELATVVAGTICINENSDELEIRYINQTLPVGYTQVDYITNSGTQYINTGVIGKQNLKIYADLELTALPSRNTPMSGCYGNNQRCYLGIIKSSGEIGYSYDTTTWSSTTISTNQRNVIEIDFTKGSQSMKLNNETILTSTNNNTLNTNRIVYLFGYSNNGGFDTYYPILYKLYRYKIYDGTSLIRDFIPCYRNSDNEVGMYDVVNNVFYTNQGTGAFTYGSITNPNEIINEEYLKDVNVNFGEKYGPINSIVLSRSAESDNVYLKDDVSIQANGLCEVKIVDNQILNWNDRADYLPDMFNKLNGLQYYLNDFSSTGITYLELCDRYTINIGENYYSCVMFNDEINISQGLEEFIHTDRPDESETDYTKSDKTDQKINQTYLIVDKQNGVIESLVSTASDLSSRISQTATSISLTTSDSGTSAGINIKLYNEDGTEIDSEGANITMSGKVEFSDLSGNGTSTINGSNITTGTIDASQVNVTNINADNITSGTISASKVNGGVLSGQTISGGSIDLTSNNNNPKLTLSGTSFGGATSTNSIVADGLRINCDNEDLISLQVEKIGPDQSQHVGYDGALWFNNTYNNNRVYFTSDNLTFDNTFTSNYRTDITNEEISITDGATPSASFSNITPDKITMDIGTNNKIKLDTSSGNGVIYSNKYEGSIIELKNDNLTNYRLYIERNVFNMVEGSKYVRITPEYVRVAITDGNYTYINADDGVVHSSKEEYKKNIKLHKNNIDLIKNTDVYSYLFKGEDDSNKSHIGLIIGDKYNTPKEIITKNGDAISLYDMCGVMWGAIKEQQEIIEKLEKRIAKLEKEK